MTRAVLVALVLLASQAPAQQRPTAAELAEAEWIRHRCDVELISNEPLIACAVTFIGAAGERRYLCEDIPSGAPKEKGQLLFKAAE